MESKNFDSENYPLQKETFLLNGIAMEIHRILGRGFLEIVYKDAFELELKNRDIHFTREKEFKVVYKTVTLPHKFFADFIVINDIIVEIKAQNGIADDHYSQTLNYLAVSKCRIGLIYNFGESSISYKKSNFIII